MSYQVIARKWRPQNFGQLVGQAHISTTLQNALKNGRIPHALLFTGPRGTGKTSSARILAKSLRCPNAVNFVPCDHCPSCEEISLSRSVDVLEIDGASNNGVDAIRELRDTVSYMPSTGKYKIYIIDEVHMLSTSAFNALLKTLEEPPEHVAFILATTEVHKIPQTILSRCQRFDFRRISTRQIAEHLKEICQKDGYTAEEEALWGIARQGDGSMRDSLSLLDQVITFSNGPITRLGVVDVLGLTDHALLYETLAALVERNSTWILSILSKVALAGYEPSLFMKDLMEQLRNLLLVKIGKSEALGLIELADSELRTLQDLAEKSQEEDIHLLFDMAVKAASDIARGTEPRIVLEMALLRMSSAPEWIHLNDFFSGKPAETTLNRGGASHKPAPSPKPSVQASAGKSALELSPEEKWFELVQRIRSADAMLAAKIEPLLFIKLAQNTLELGVPPKVAFLKDQLLAPETQAKLKSFIEQAWGPGYAFIIHLTQDPTAGTSAQKLGEERQQKKDKDLAAQVAEHPKVKLATSVFKGQIKSIRESGSQKGGS